MTDNQETVAQDLFASQNKKSNKKGSYKRPIPSTESYSGVEDTVSLAKERGTIRTPLEQKLEFDALLEMSVEHNYSYELLAELTFRAVSNLSKEDRDRYNEILNRLKQAELHKLRKKTKKK